MRTASVAFLLSTLTSAVLTPVVRRLAIRWGLLDEAASSRKIHDRPIPRVGGVAIIVAFMLPLLGLGVFETSVGRMFYADEQRALGLILAGLLIGLLGLYDDVKGMRARHKLVVQIALAVALYFGGFQVHNIASPFGNALPLGPLALPFTVLWIVGVINAINLIDGLDGLAGGVALFAVGATFVIAFHRGDGLMMLFMACLGGAVLGFLFYNFNPASIFMGDSGAMFLGLVLAVTSLQTSQKSSTAVAILVPIIVLGLPIADTLVAMARRAFQGRPIFAADRDHIHHRLLGMGMSQRRAVLVLYAACILLAATALALTFASSVEAAMLLALLACAFVVGLRLLGYFRVGAASASSRQRQRNRELRGTVRALGEQLARASNEKAIWETIRELATLVSAAGMSLEFWAVTDQGDRSSTQFSNYDGPAGGALSPSFEITGPEDCRGQLTFHWNDGRAEIDRDEEIAIEVLCDHIAAAWSRIRARRSDRPSAEPPPVLRH